MKKNLNLVSVKDFSQEELRKWQLKLLEILVYFRDFCFEHNLCFWLAAGTCLGAVRHNGFIPWDDDLDVQMPREDYDRLLEIWDKEADTTRFKCCVTTENKPSRFPMATIRSTNTTCIYEHSVNDDICQGLKIDVEFLDGVPEGKINRGFNWLCGKVFALFRAQRVPARSTLLQTLASRLLLCLFCSSHIQWRVSRWCEKQIKKTKFGSTEFVRYLACAPRPYKSFEHTLFVDFEGYEMPIPEGYDAMLRAAYGDYMKLPSMNHRKPATDNLLFYDLDRGYEEYRGIQFLINKR